MTCVAMTELIGGDDEINLNNKQNYKVLDKSSIFAENVLEGLHIKVHHYYYNRSATYIALPFASYICVYHFIMV